MAHEQVIINYAFNELKNGLKRLQTAIKQTSNPQEKEKIAQFIEEFEKRMWFANGMLLFNKLYERNELKEPEIKDKEDFTKQLVGIINFLLPTLSLSDIFSSEKEQAYRTILVIMNTLNIFAHALVTINDFANAEVFYKNILSIYKLLNEQYPLASSEIASHTEATVVALEKLSMFAKAESETKTTPAQEKGQAPGNS